MKNIVVIGGTRGVGQEIVALLQGNHQLYVVSRNPPQSAIADVRYIQSDITGALPDATLFPAMIDGLVYCPGSINLKPFHRITESELLEDWQVNFLGAVKCIQQFLPMLQKGSSPSIVLFSTVAVQTGMAFHASIAAAKGAVEGLTRSLAAELAPAIRVNCIAPSLTNTSLAAKLLSTIDKTEASAKRHPLQRVGQPGDIASMACFLLSEQASWMTGQIIHIDGGLSSVKI